MVLNLFLIDTNPALFKYWGSSLNSVLKTVRDLNIAERKLPCLQLFNTSIESLMVEHSSSLSTAIVTPSNSLSYMGGGFDKYLLQSLLINTNETNYKKLEGLIQESTLRKFNGLLPLYSINVVNLLEVCQHSDFNYLSSLAYKNWNLTNLIQVPTMMVPSEACRKSSIFNTMWSLFSYLDSNSDLSINNLIIPGIGTGYGKLNEKDVAQIMIGATIIFNIKFHENDSRLNYLKKSLLVLFFLKKDYRLFENGYDLEELEKLMTDYGKWKVLQEDFDNDDLMDWEELFKCIKI